MADVVVVSDSDNSEAETHTEETSPSEAGTLADLARRIGALEAWRETQTAQIEEVEEAAEEAQQSAEIATDIAVNASQNAYEAQETAAVAAEVAVEEAEVTEEAAEAAEEAAEEAEEHNAEDDPTPKNQHWFFR